ncbi:MAG TPA: efflux RND transporter periplasmic adaptor subunit [Pirellulales bacterium]|jgi:RND family efflux transporter MFP subunit|nr:efflux RND transporter periplasmic adaptor subunit [Pirellulales bacterium]
MFHIKKLWWIGGVAGLATVAGGFALLPHGHPAALAHAAAAEHAQPGEQSASAIRVETIAPTPGGIVRKTVQPGSAHSFQSAGLYAKVSGYLKSQAVDIGSVVKRGQVLAEIDIPELAQELLRDQGQLRQAEAEVVQSQAAIASAEAEQKAAEALIAEAEAHVKRATSEREFREKAYDRIRNLHSLKSVEERLVDEKLDQLNAAGAAELAARSTVISARQQAAAAAAKVRRAEADLLVAKAKIDVVQATVARTGVLLDYTKIVSPYDGVVTERNFHPGAFIRSADQSEHQPLLAVDRIDLMRIVVQVPDRDVPFTQPGDEATIVFDALPGQKFTGKVARVSASENPESRTMRVEIDVPNTDGILRDGMYGQVEIELEKASPGVTIPSACVISDVRANQAKVYVVEQGKVRLTTIETGKDTGVLIEVKQGLTTSDRVVLKPPSSLIDGLAVEAVAAPVAQKSGH